MARLPGTDALVGLLSGRAAAQVGEAAAQVGAAAVQVTTAAAETGRVLSQLSGALATDSAVAVTSAVRSAVDLVGEARETVRALHRLALRADGIVAALEQPLLDLAPGLARLAVVLDDPVVEQVPDTLRQVQDDLLPVLRTLADTHERVAFIAGSTERIMTFVDETSRTIAGLPGAGLLGRRRAPGRVITVEQVPPPAP